MADVSFTIVAPARDVPLGDKVVLTLLVKNTSAQPLYLNCRFAAVPKLGDIDLSVHRNGKKVPFGMRVRLAPLRNGDFLLLQPGTCVVTGVELTWGFSLTEPGEYEVSATYVSDEIPRELAGKPVFRGRVTATPVHITVTGAH